MKIALIGSAPSSIRLAPYNDPEWQIWGCSPGAYGVAGPHAHAWFELHRWEPQIPGHVGTGQAWFSPEYCEYLTRHKGTVWMAEPAPEIPNAKRLPVEELVNKYGPYFFTSSLSWMWAMALETPGVTEIAMFGVDMAAHEEYALQRPGCQYFITLAIQRGIKVTVPPESDILQPSLWYGVTENNPMMIKLNARRIELMNRKAAADQRATQAQQESMFLSGALDDIKYMMDTWVTHQAWIEPTLCKTGNEGRAQSYHLDISEEQKEECRKMMPEEVVAVMDEWSEEQNEKFRKMMPEKITFESDGYPDPGRKIDGRITGAADKGFKRL